MSLLAFGRGRISVALGIAFFFLPNLAQAEICNGVEATIVYGDGDDVIVGTNQGDVIFAGGGNDTIDGAGGDDIICGGPGNDTIHGGNSKDILFGEGGNDIIFGDNAQDDINGGDGVDICDGGNSLNTAFNCESVINASNTGTDDNVGPIITFAVPAVPYTNDVNIAVEVDWLDVNTAVDPTSALIEANSANITSAFAIDGNQATGSFVAAGEGAVVFDVYIEDFHNNSATASRSITVDLTPPYFGYFAPIDGALLTVNTAPIETVFADGLSGIDAMLTQLVVDGDVVASGSGTSPLSYLPLGGWTDGVHTWSVTVFDNAGNSNSSGTFSFAVDTFSCDAEACGLISAVSGGSVVVDNPLSLIYGARIDIPPGALVEDTLITVDIPDSKDPLDIAIPAGVPVVFGPIGTQLSLPATITLPYIQSLLGVFSEQALRIYIQDAGGDWIMYSTTGLDTANDLISTEVSELLDPLPGFNPVVDWTTSTVTISNSSLPADGVATTEMQVTARAPFTGQNVSSIACFTFAYTHGSSSESGLHCPGLSVYGGPDVVITVDEMGTTCGLGCEADDVIRISVPASLVPGTPVMNLTWFNPSGQSQPLPPLEFLPFWSDVGPTTCSNGGISNDPWNSFYPDIAVDTSASPPNPDRTVWAVWLDENSNIGAESDNRVMLRVYDESTSTWEAVNNEGGFPTADFASTNLSIGVDYNIGNGAANSRSQYPAISLYKGNPIVAFRAGAATKLTVAGVGIYVKIYDVANDNWVLLTNTTFPIRNFMDAGPFRESSFDVGRAGVAMPSMAVYDDPVDDLNDFLYVTWTDGTQVYNDQVGDSVCNAGTVTGINTTQVFVRRINLQDALNGVGVWEEVGYLADVCEDDGFGDRRSDDDPGISYSQGMALHPKIAIHPDGTPYIAYIDDNVEVKDDMVSPPGTFTTFHLVVKKLLPLDTNLLTNPLQRRYWSEPLAIYDLGYTRCPVGSTNPSTNCALGPTSPANRFHGFGNGLNYYGQFKPIDFIFDDDSSSFIAAVPVQSSTTGSNFNINYTKELRVLYLDEGGMTPSFVDPFDPVDVRLHATFPSLVLVDVLPGVALPGLIYTGGRGAGIGSNNINMFAKVSDGLTSWLSLGEISADDGFFNSSLNSGNPPQFNLGFLASGNIGVAKDSNGVIYSTWSEEDVAPATPPDAEICVQKY